MNKSIYNAFSKQELISALENIDLFNKRYNKAPVYKEMLLEKIHSLSDAIRIHNFEKITKENFEELNKEWVKLQKEHDKYYSLYFGKNYLQSSP